MAALIGDGWPDQRPGMTDLASRSIAAVTWGGGGAAVRIILQIATQIALARILGPEHYGLFAIGAIVIGFSNFFSDVGLAYGLIQKPEVTARDLRFVFTWQLLLGVFVTAVVAGLSGPIASFLGDARAENVVSALAVVCLTNALTAPAHNLLKRNLDFKRIQLAHIASYVAGYVVVGVPLALSGATVWALVAAWVVQASATLLILYAGVRHPLRPLLWFDGGRQIIRYGTTVFATNVTNWLIGNIERVVISRFFAARDIGLYATAYNLLYSPAASLMGIVQVGFFSAGSRMASERQRLARVYLSLVALAATLVLPVFASIAAIAPTFVSALYGVRWEGAAELVTPLALAMPLFLLWGLTTPLLALGGEPAREFKLQLPMAVLWVGVSWLAAHHSVAAVAWAVAALFALRYALILGAAMQLLPLSLAGVWRAASGGLLLALLCAAFAAVFDESLKAIGVPAPGRLAADGLLTAAVYVLLLTVWPGLVAGECGPLIARLADRSPPPLAFWLRRFYRRG